jgi:hypothetical protein
LDEKEDMLICCLVCKKWLGILGQEIKLKIDRQSIFDLLNSSSHKLYRQPKIVEMESVAIDNISDDFALILQNCKEITFNFCKFESSQGLLDTLKNCKNVKYLKKNNCSYHYGIINEILICEEIRALENAEIQEFHWRFIHYNNDWIFIKIFTLLGIQLNKLNWRVHFFNSEDYMEMIEYIKNSYETKMKCLHITARKEMNLNDLFQFLIEWDGLKLDAVGIHIGKNYELMGKFIEKQTGLKDLSFSKDVINLDDCPTQLEFLNVLCSNAAMARATNMKLSRFKNLQSCNLSMYGSYSNEGYQFNIPKEMVMLKRLTLKKNRGDRMGKIDLKLKTPYSPQMEILSVTEMGLSNLTMLHIIKNMPNLKTLEINCTHGVST